MSKSVLAKDWKLAMVLAADLTPQQRLAAMLELFADDLVGAMVSVSKKNFIMLNATVCGKKIQLGGSAAPTKTGGVFAKLSTMNFGRRKAAQAVAEPAPEKTTKVKKTAVVKKNSKEF